MTEESRQKMEEYVLDMVLSSQSPDYPSGIWGQHEREVAEILAGWLANDDFKEGAIEVEQVDAAAQEYCSHAALKASELGAMIEWDKEITGNGNDGSESIRG
jgi:hypothetical protein